MSINNTFRTLNVDNIEGVISEKNYVKNGFEQGVVAGWNKFTVSLSGGLPSGTPTIGSASSLTTFSVTSTGSLCNKNSLEVGTTSAVWSAGQGIISDEFIIERGDLGKTMSAFFDYQVTSGSSAINFSATLGSQTFAVFVYNATTNTWITPVGYLGFVDPSSPSRMPVEFNSSPTALTAYRFAFVCLQSTSANTIRILFDNFSVFRKSELIPDNQISVRVNINTNQSAFTNTGLLIDLLNDVGFVIDYSAKRVFLDSGSNEIAQIGSGRIIGYVPVFDPVVSGLAYPESGSSGINFEIDNSTGDIKYTSDNLYPSPTYTFQYGYLNLIVRDLK
jgi:hypothetical protein